MSEWISVKDRMPKKNQRILLKIKGRKTCDFGMYSEDGLWYAITRKFPFELSMQSGITHWMPLPQGPAE